MPFDFASVTTPFRMQPGLRRLEAGAVQLTPNAPGSRALREKLAVLGAYPGQALLKATGFDETPALAALGAHAQGEHPDTWRTERAGGGHALRLGWSVDADGCLHRHPGAVDDLAPCLEALPPAWRLPALFCLAFAEDFAVIDGHTAQIPWLAVCLPSGWAPEEKIGHHFAQVHAPVADNQLIVKASEHLARLVTGSDRWERHVWTITRHPRLHAHPAHVDPAPWPADADVAQLAGRAWFRTERQTFVPVAGQSQAIFTIHVNVTPLAEALETPQQARQVHDALATMSPAVLEYRGLTAARDRLLAWLSQRANP